MVYLADRFELNLDQRFWLSFLFAATYCVPTAYYILNEFPDFRFVDPGRMTRWWNENRPRIYFQSDRRWVRSRNQFVDQVVSYQALVGESHEPHFIARGHERPADVYARA